MSNKLYKLSNINKESVAEDILKEYSPINLNEPIPLDVDWFMEDCLYLSHRSEHITFNNSILGIIAFGDTVINGYDDFFKHKKILLQDGDVITEKCLSGPADLKRMRYTKMHECCHRMLHRTYYSPDGREYAFRENKFIACRNIETNIMGRNHTEEDWIEWQADTLAASILMPKDIFIETTQREIRKQGIKRKYLERSDGRNKIFEVITAVSEKFEVSKQATSIRVQQLGLYKDESDYYSLM